MVRMSELHKFIFDGLPVRGMLVRLTDGWREVLARARETTQATCRRRCARCWARWPRPALLMQANIKFNGALVLQMHRRRAGQAGGRRGAAGPAPSASPPRWSARSRRGARLEALVNVHGQGRCAITLDPKEQAARASSPTRAWCRCTATGASRCSGCREVLEHYMLQSEQLDTRLVLAADDEVAAGPADPAPAGRGRGQPRQRTQRGRDRRQRGLQPHRAAGGDPDARRSC